VLLLLFFCTANDHAVAVQSKPKAICARKQMILYVPFLAGRRFGKSKTISLTLWLDSSLPSQSQLRSSVALYTDRRVSRQ
jgi:hypothetical protein